MSSGPIQQQIGNIGKFFKKIFLIKLAQILSGVTGNAKQKFYLLLHVWISKTEIRHDRSVLI